MKTASRFMLVTGVMLGAAFIASGAQASKTYHVTRNLRAPQEFQQLKTADKATYVCTQCSMLPLESTTTVQGTMDVCKEGNSVNCPSCNKIVTNSRRGPRMNDRQRPEVRYVNDKGEACVFVVKTDN